MSDSGKQETGAERFRKAMQPGGVPSDDAEENLWAGGFSGKSMVGTWFLLTVLSCMLVVACLVLPPFIPVFVGVIALIWVYGLMILVYRKLSIHYRLTSQRLFHEVGILTRTTNRIEVIDMNDITFQQGLIERMMGTGTIYIQSTDLTDPKLVLNGIDNVKEVAALLDNAHRKERVRRGVHITNV